MLSTRQWQRAAAAAILAAGVLFGAAAAPAPCRAAQKDDAAGTVAVTFLEIHASREEKEHIDPALKAIANELKRSKYNCFRMGVRGTKDVALGKIMEMALREDYAARVQPQKETEKAVRLVLTWVHYEKDKEGKRKARVLLSVPMTLHKGKYLLSGGWKLKKGVLMGAVAIK